MDRGAERKLLHLQHLGGCKPSPTHLVVHKYELKTYEATDANQSQMQLYIEYKMKGGEPVSVGTSPLKPFGNRDQFCDTSSTITSFAGIVCM